MSVIINGTTGISTDGGSDLFGTGTIGGSLTLTSGTANGVTYLNGSKVLTSGSALTFDGSQLFTLTSSSGPLFQFSDATTAFGTIGSQLAITGAGAIDTFVVTSTNGKPLSLRAPSGQYVTFDLATSEQMRLTSTGLGIGTSSPATKLDVVGTAKVYTGSPNGSYPASVLAVRQGNADTTNIGLLVQGGVGSTSQDIVSIGYDNAGTHVGLVRVNNSAELLCSNNVGIGTSSPSQKLHVVGKVLATDNLEFSTSDTAVVFQSGAGRFFTGGFERMRIDSAGNLGLGVTPSAAWASSAYIAAQFGYGGVIMSSAVSVGVTVFNTGANFKYDGSDYRRINAEEASQYQQASGAHNWRIAASSTANSVITWTQAMTLTAAGDLGVGATSPGAKLELYSTANANFGQKIYHNSSSLGTHRFPQIEFAQTPVGQSYQNTVILRQQNSDYGNYPSLALITNAAGAGEATRMFVDGYTGNVGIGTSSPAVKLDFGITTNGTQIVNLRKNNNSIAGLGVNAEYGVRIAGPSDAAAPVSFGEISISDGTTFSEFMRIDSSGNVGIGTSSPTISAGYTSLSINNATSSGYVVLQNNGTNKSDWYISGGTGPAYLRGVGVALGLAATGANNIVFDTNGTERMRIDSSGNLLVGTTSASGWGGKVSIQSDSSGAAYPLAINNTASGATSYVVVDFYRSGARTGYISNTATTTAYNTSSDYRLKEDWVAVADASTRVNALKPINFAWKVDGSRVDGFLAHELAEVVPEAVTGEKDAVDAEGKPVYQGIDQSKLVPLVDSGIARGVGTNRIT
jgi:hypothetical protein